MNTPSTNVPYCTVTEINLTSMQSYTNPYKDITITAAFTGPQGQTIHRDAFWDGQNLWKIRFAPIATGTWTWKTICSDNKNTGLHHITGTIECIPGKNPAPVYQHGFLRVSRNGRFFTHADNTPFFWLGDTHWQMPDTERVTSCNHPEHGTNACPFGGQFQHLVADRKSRGFTVYQTYPAATRSHWWTTPYTQINPDRFRNVFDVQVNHLASQGFVIAMGLGHFNNSMHMPEEDFLRFTRYMVARYGAYPIVWITCQEMNAPENNGQNRIAVWQTVAKEIEQADGYGHPHSGHQWVLDVTERPLGGESWHDWFALQGGHLNSKLTPQARYAGYYSFLPAKPILETEAMYEAVDCGGTANTHDARMSAWKAMLCGCAGYTYGAAGIWALKWDALDPQWKNYNHAIDAWYSGMNLPGTTQMTIMKNFFTALDWTKLTPRFMDSAWSQWRNPEQCVLATDDNRLYLVYCYGETSSGTVKNLDLSAIYEAQWFNPRTGEYTTKYDHIRPEHGEWTVPEKPDTLDWILLIQNKKPR